MSEYISKQALLDWLNNEIDVASGNDWLVRWAYRQVRRFVDAPSDQGEVPPNYTDTDIKTAFTRELTNERVSTAAAYWLDCSPHERWIPDGIILARYAREAMAEIQRLRTALEGAADTLNRLMLNSPHVLIAYEDGKGFVPIGEERLKQIQEALSPQSEKGE